MTSEAYDDVAEANAEVIDKTVDGEERTTEAEKKEESDSESEDKAPEDPDDTAGINGWDVLVAWLWQLSLREIGM